MMITKIYTAIRRRSITFYNNIIDFCYGIVVYRNLKFLISNHLTIGLKYLHKKKVFFPHPIGIVIGKNVIIGENCTIYQNVTIGAKTNAAAIKGKYPRIGNNVIIGAGALIIGDITIGNNVYIGAGSVITKSIDSNSVVVGNPGRVIKKLTAIN